MNASSNSISLAQNDTGPRRSLILAGGGMRVAYQAGVLKALEELGHTFAHGDGTSGGTMNLAMLLSGLSPDEMCSRWRTLDVHKFNAAMPVGQYLHAWDMTGLSSSKGIRRDVFPHLGIDIAAVNKSTGMAGTFNVCNFSQKAAEVTYARDLTLDLLVAGISLPMFMPAVLINGDWYTDAVWIKDANLMDAVAQGAEELWVVWCIGNSHDYLSGAFHQYVHMIEMAGNGRLFEEFKQISGLDRPVKVHVIKPQYPLPLDPEFFLGRITASTLVEMGYADTYRYIQTEMQPAGVALSPAATHMLTPAAGVSFSSTMKGNITIETSSAAVRLSLTTAIHDLAAFLRGDLSVLQRSGNISITHAGFSSYIPLIEVTTEPSADGDAHELILRFRQGSSNYFLKGQLRRKASQIVMTRLPFTLYREDGTALEVVGSGTLRMGPAGLFLVIRTVYATNVQKSSERILTLFRFGVLYLRGLL